MFERIDNGMTNDAIWGAWMSPKVEICDECKQPLDDCECERCDLCGLVEDDCECFETDWEEYI